MSDLTGTRIYNRGDVANVEHHGEIVSERSDDFGSWVKIRIDDREDRGGETYEVPRTMINDVDAGNGRTRIVTEAAWAERRDAEISKVYEAAGKVWPGTLAFRRLAAFADALKPEYRKPVYSRASDVLTAIATADVESAEFRCEEIGATIRIDRDGNASLGRVL